MKALVECDVLQCCVCRHINALTTVSLKRGLASSPTPKKEMMGATWLVGKQPLLDYQTHFVFTSAVHST
jgi:hypothetical protein